MKNATALIVLGTLAVLATVDARSPTSKSYLESLRSGTVCPDKEYSCSDGQTCCKLKAGGFGCCGERCSSRWRRPNRTRSRWRPLVRA